MPKTELKLVFKKEISQQTYYLIFQTDSDLSFTPGQFLSLEIKPKEMRPYSIVEVSQNPTNFTSDIDLPTLTSGSYISFMISTKPGGLSSKYVETAKLGEVLMGVGPAGRFRLAENSKPKTFIATGTGLAPFVGMIKQTLDSDPKTPITVYFASWDLQQSFAKIFIQPLITEYPNSNIKLIKVAEDAQSQADQKSIFEGRVTDIVPSLEKNLLDQDFYLCGHPAMCQAMEKVLLENQVSEGSIKQEKFG